MAALRQTPCYRLKHTSRVLSVSLTGSGCRQRRAALGGSGSPLLLSCKICVVFFLKMKR